MPHGMYLRSACDWHLDPANVATIERFLGLQGRTPADVEPLSLQFYLSYAQWFQEQQQIAALPVYVERLDHVDGQPYCYRATFEDGRVFERAMWPSPSASGTSSTCLRIW